MRKICSFVLMCAILSLIGFGCSKGQNSGTNPDSVSIKINHVWIVSFGNGGTRIIEIENVGAKPIKAFNGSWWVLDDLGNKRGGESIYYDSHTSYFSSPNGDTSEHVIATGEHICIYYSVIDHNPPEIMAAVDVKDILSIFPKSLGLGQKDIDDNLIIDKYGIGIDQIGFVQ